MFTGYLHLVILLIPPNLVPPFIRVEKGKKGKREKGKKGKRESAGGGGRVELPTSTITILLLKISTGFC